MDSLTKIQELFILTVKSKHIVLIGHANPDGDCIGALMGLNGFFENMGKEISVIVPNHYPSFLNFLDKNNEVIVHSLNPQISKTKIDEADLILCVDFNALHRIDTMEQHIKTSEAKRVLIDHHPLPGDGFELIFSHTEMSSASELTYWLLKELDKLLSKELGYSCFNLNIYTALYTGMMTDTNNFANSVTTSTFRMAADLMAAGVDKEYVQNEVFGCFNECRMRLMGYMLYSNMKVYPDLHASIMVLSKKTKDEFGFEEGDSEGFVNLALNIKGIEVAALFTENKDAVRVSLRSKKGISVNAMAKAYFNGGGHERAAGGKLTDIKIDEAEKYYVDALKKFYKEKGIDF